MMSFMPDTIPSADDPSEAKLVLWDLRLKDEVMQWPLHDCGNGAVNATAFEECDYTGDPNPTVDTTYIYQTNTEDTSIQGTTFPLPEEIFWDYTDEAYYTCSTICLKEAVALCGDGVPSNGPPTVSTYTQQDSGTYGYEECDDGNSVDSDGCTSCTIDVGYECPTWGVNCNPICGNGIVEADTDGTLTAILRVGQSASDTAEVEECDMGTSLNKADTLGSDLYACTSDCKVSDKSKWRCTKEYDVNGDGTWTSKCEWLCGNQKVDIEEDDGQYINDQSALGTYTAMTTPEQCDFGQWYWEGQKPTGYYNENSGFSEDHTVNANLLWGCTSSCTIETGFKCPDATETSATSGSDSWALATCTDRCGDGIYDGPYAEVGRTSAYPTCVTSAISFYPTSDFTCW